MAVNLTKVHFQLHNMYYYYSYKIDVVLFFVFFVSVSCGFL